MAMPKLSRRKLFQSCTAATVAARLATKLRAAPVAPAVVGLSNTEVDKLETVWIEPPYKTNPAQYIVPWREGHMTNTQRLCRITLANGVAGWGGGAVNEAVEELY